MASLVNMMVGQCGNQVGAATYSILYNERPFAGEHSLFDESGHARAVMVDGEAKVVGALVKREGSGPFKRSNAFVEDSGRGNNWALGYYGPRGDSSIVERAMEAFRKELEVSDAYRGSLIFHSLCGGTGAGLGSRIMEEMRDALPKSPLVSTTVLPFSVGELPLQHYNATLCLSRIIKETEACILFSNNSLLALASKRNAPKSGVTVRPADAANAQVKTSHLNRYIGLALASILRPNTVDRVPRGKTAVPWDIAGSVSAVAPTTETKFVEVWAVQERSRLPPHMSEPPWATLGKRLAGEIPRFCNLSTATNAEPQLRKTLTAGYQVFARGHSVFGGSGAGEEDGAVAARSHVLKALDIAPSVRGLYCFPPPSPSPSSPKSHLASRDDCYSNFTTNGSWVCCPSPVTAAHPRALSVMASRCSHTVARILNPDPRPPTPNP
jgi:hypothetical protein